MSKARNATALNERAATAAIDSTISHLLGVKEGARAGPQGLSGELGVSHRLRTAGSGAATPASRARGASPRVGTAKKNLLSAAGRRAVSGAAPRSPRASVAALARIRSMVKAMRPVTGSEPDRRRQVALNSVLRGLLDPDFGSRAGSDAKESPPDADDSGSDRDESAASTWLGAHHRTNETRAQPEWATRRGMRVTQGGRALLNAAAPAGPFSEEELGLLAARLDPRGVYAAGTPQTARGRLQARQRRPRRADVAAELNSAESGSAALAFAREVEHEGTLKAAQAEEARAAQGLGKGTTGRGSPMRRQRRASLTSGQPTAHSAANGPPGRQGAEAEAREVAKAVAGTQARFAAAAASSLIIAAPPSAAAESAARQAATTADEAAALCAAAAGISSFEVQAYLRCCAAARCEPARHLLRQLPSPSIVLSARGLGAGHATQAFALASALPRCSVLTHLDLSSNCLDDAAAGALCRALTASPAPLASLDFSDNALTAGAMPDLAAVARRTRFLGLAGQGTPGLDGLGLFALVAGLVTPLPRADGLDGVASGPAAFTSRHYCPPLWEQDAPSLRYGVAAAVAAAKAAGGLVVPGPAKPEGRGAGGASSSSAAASGSDSGSRLAGRLAAAASHALAAVRGARMGPLFGGPVSKAGQGPTLTGGPASTASKAAAALRFASSRRMSARLARAIATPRSGKHLAMTTRTQMARTGDDAGTGTRPRRPGAEGEMTLSRSGSAAVRMQDVTLPRPTRHSPAECGLRELDLSRCGFTDRSAAPACRLAGIPSLQALDLAWNGMGSRGLLPLLRALCSPTVMLLPVSISATPSEDRQAIDGGQGAALWRAARAALKARRSRLRRLVARLQSGSKGRSGASSSSPSSSSDPKDFPKGPCTPIESVMGGAPMPSDPVLATLQSVSLPLLPGPLPRSFLRSLSLAFCGLDDDVGPTLAAMLAGDMSAPGGSASGSSHRGEAALPSLVELDLSNNKLGERTGRCLALALSRNSTLRALRVGFNPLGKLATLALVRALDPVRAPLGLDVSSGLSAGAGLHPGRSGSGAAHPAEGFVSGAGASGAGPSLAVGGNSVLSELGLENTCLPVHRELNVPAGLLDELALAIDEEGAAVQAAAEAAEAAEEARQATEAAASSGKATKGSAASARAKPTGKGAAASAPAKSGVVRSERHDRARALLRHLLPAHFGCMAVQTVPTGAAPSAADADRGVSLANLGTVAGASSPAGALVIDAEAFLLEDKLAGLRRLRGSPLAGLALPDEASAAPESSEDAMQDVWETLQRVLERRHAFASVTVEFPEQARTMGGRAGSKLTSAAVRRGPLPGQWTAESSVFRARLSETDAESLVDTPALLDRCFEADWTYTKIERVVPDATQRAALKPVLKRYYPVTRELFRLYCSASGSDPFSISFGLWTDMRRDMGITSREKEAVLDTAFVAANVELKDDEANPDHALCRYELQEVLVRSALILYPASSGITGPAASLDMLLTRHVVPAALRMFGIADPSEPFSNQFRIEQLYAAPVDAVFRRFWRQVAALFRRFATSDTDASKPFMSITQWIDFLAAAGFYGGGGGVVGAVMAGAQGARGAGGAAGKPAPVITQELASSQRLTERDARSLFQFSNPTVIDELHRSARARRRFRHTHLTLTSFLEALARLASSQACPNNLPTELIKEARQQLADRAPAAPGGAGHRVAVASATGSTPSPSPGRGSRARSSSRGRARASRSVSVAAELSGSLGTAAHPRPNPWGEASQDALPPQDLADRLILTVAQCAVTNHMSLRGLSLLPQRMLRGEA